MVVQRQIRVCGDCYPNTWSEILRKYRYYIFLADTQQNIRPTLKGWSERIFSRQFQKYNTYYRPYGSSYAAQVIFDILDTVALFYEPLSPENLIPANSKRFSCELSTGRFGGSLLKKMCRVSSEQVHQAGCKRNSQRVISTFLVCDSGQTLLSNTIRDLFCKWCYFRIGLNQGLSASN